MSPTATLAAPAKVNLRLRVLRRRPDGYHDIDTLFQAIDLADDVTVGLGGTGVRLDVDGAEVGPARSNLAYRAATRLAAEVGRDAGFEIRLVKRIPAGAGLGGGSSDGAAVLRCAAELLDLAAGDARVARVAAGLGSDVSFFLCGSPFARGRGRGEQLEPLEPLPAADLVIVSPPVHVSSAAAYEALGKSGRSERPGPEPLTSGPGRWEEMAALACNDFQEVIARAHPQVRRALDALAAAGAAFALMSGSGSSAFGMFADRASAEGAAARLTQELGWPCRAARTLELMPTPEIG